MTSLPDPGPRARPRGTPAGRPHRRHSTTPAPLLALLPDRGRPARGLELGPPRRGTGRLGPRAGVHRPRPRPVRRTPRRGGARWSATAVVRDEVRAPGHRPGRLRLHLVCRGLAAGATLVVPEVVVGAGTAAGGSPPSAPRRRCRRRPRLLPQQSRRASPRASPSPTARCRPAEWAGAVSRGRASGSPTATSTRSCWPATCACSAEEPDRPALAAPAAGRALRHDVGLRRRRPRRRHPRDARAPREGPGHLPRAGRHDPPHRRRRARPRAGRVAGPLEQGPRGARVRRPVGGRRAAPALLVDERARVAVRAAPVQRHAPGHRRRRRAAPTTRPR